MSKSSVSQEARIDQLKEKYLDKWIEFPCSTDKDSPGRNSTYCGQVADILTDLYVLSPNWEFIFKCYARKDPDKQIVYQFSSSAVSHLLSSSFDETRLLETRLLDPEDVALLVLAQ